LLDLEVPDAWENVTHFRGPYIEEISKRSAGMRSGRCTTGDQIGPLRNRPPPSKREKRYSIEVGTRFRA